MEDLSENLSGPDVARAWGYKPASAVRPPLLKTSVQLRPDTITRLKEHYPSLTLSEIIRMSVDYVLERLPEVRVAKTTFEDRHE